MPISQVRFRSQMHYMIATLMYVAYFVKTNKQTNKTKTNQSVNKAQIRTSDNKLSIHWLARVKRFRTETCEISWCGQKRSKKKEKCTVILNNYFKSDFLLFKRPIFCRQCSLKEVLSVVSFNNVVRVQLRNKKYQHVDKVIFLATIFLTCYMEVDLD